MTGAEDNILFWGTMIGFVLAVIVSRIIKTDRVMQRMVFAVVLFGTVASAAISALYVA